MTITGIANYLNNVNGYGSDFQSFMSNASQASSSKSASTTGKTTLSQAGQNYVASVVSASNSLKQSADKLTSKTTSAFDQYSASSSNNELMSVKANTMKNGQSAVNEKTSEVDVQIGQVATTQKNEGAAMKSTQLGSFKTGANNFAIETGGKTYNFSISVSAGDSAQRVQQKMADAINKQRIGINATVSTNKQTGTSSLNLESVSTGEKNGFTVKDATGGDLVAKVGAGAVKQAAGDAVYAINGGGVKRSASNEIDLGNGMTATLKKSSAETVTASVKRDTTGIMDGIRSFVQNFNNALSTTRGSTNGDKLRSVATAYSSSLSRAGINVDRRGNMSIDETKLKKSIENNTAASALGRTGSTSGGGFLNSVSRTATSMKDSPIDKQTAKSYATQNNSYMSLLNNLQNSGNPYGSSGITGLLFNSSF